MGLIKTSADGVTFADSASENEVVVGSASWRWSLTLGLKPSSQVLDFPMVICAP